MMTVEMMRECKKLRGFSYQAIAEKSGVPLGTVQKVLGGYSKSPRERTLKKLEQAFLQEMDASALQEDKACCFKDGAAAYAAERLTVEECLKISGDKRVELIDGVIYDMAPPKRMHQRLLMKLALAISSYSESQGGHCEVYPAPFFVRLHADDYTYVEPDISVICDPSKLSEEGCEGAPDWIIEITSPSTKRMDYGIKLFRYRSAGVKLYWIVDPEEKKVTVYHFNSGDEVQFYTFQDQVEVALAPGFVIDFARITGEPT